MGRRVQQRKWLVHRREYKDEATQDEADVQHLYTTLEEIIVPLIHTTESGIPKGWIAYMKSTDPHVLIEFSMRRMVKDYTEQYYLPAAANGSLRQITLRLALRLQRGKVNWRSGGRRSTWKPHYPAVASSPWAKRSMSGPNSGSMASTKCAMQTVNRENGALIYEGSLTPDDSGILTLGMRARPCTKH
ncbi:MAG: hypothetical protein R2867_24965 [Caldilineaceae bacterium]